MNKLISLTKVLLKSSGSFLSKRKAKVNRNKSILLVILIMISLIPLTISFGLLVSKSIDGLKTINQEGLILNLGFTISSMIVFIFGIFYVMGTFYFSMDIDNLLPLPFRPSHILGSKFIVVVIYEYLTQSIVLLPIIIVYGIKVNVGIMYYLYSIIVFLTLPIVPLVLSSIIVMSIMRFTDVAKNKDRFKVIGGIIGIFFGIGINLFIQKYIGNGANQQELVDLLLKGNNSLVGKLSTMFVNVKYASLGIINSSSISGFLNILLYIGILVLSLIIFMVLGEALYFKGVVGISETTSKRKKLNNEELNKATVKNSSLKTYTIKELKILFRTPAYFMNCILSNFLMPIFMLIPIFINSEVGNLINKAAIVLKDYNDAGGVVVIFFAFIIFTTSTSAITATSISREGHNLFVNKYLPIGYDIQIKAKVLSGIIISTMSLILMLGVVAFLLKPSIVILGVILLVSLIGIVFASMIGILIDLYNPKLNWDNEQKAVKQNLNVFISMLLGLLFAGISIFIVFMFKLNTWTTLGLIVILFGAIITVLWKILMNKGIKIYNNIEC